MSSTISLRQCFFYFLRLGATCFGGPVVLSERMHRDLVMDRAWLTEEEYRDGFAMAQFCPGPLALQLALYIGWLRVGVIGATAAGVAFLLPAFFMVVILAVLEQRYGHFSWIHGLSLGMGAVIIAIIARSAFRLSRSTLQRDVLTWFLFAMGVATTIFFGSRIVWIFLASGIVAAVIRARRDGIPPPSMHGIILALPGVLGSGSLFSSTSTLWTLTIYFLKMGAVVFGGGFVIIPLLHHGVVEQFQWVTEQQFLDAVAVSLLTPGPVLVAVVFIGYFAAGFLGSLLAIVSICLPCYLIVVLLVPHYRRLVLNPHIKHFVTGVVATAVGALMGAAYLLGRGAIVSWWTGLLALVVFLLLLRWKKFPEPLLVGLGGLLGLLLQSL